MNAGQPAPEYLEALRSMPKDEHGHIVDLRYVPIRRQAALESAWRDWCRTHDRKTWPAWLHDWAAARARERRKDQAPIGNPRGAT